MSAKKALIIVYIALVLSLVVFMPKIYLRNNIYYISKEINKLQTQYISLKEERKFLQQQHEDALFKNQIMDSLILQNSEE